METSSDRIVQPTPPGGAVKFRVILLIDMDAFYASVEQRDDPNLSGKPVIVGSPPPRSIVATASREARKFGIYSSQNMAEAKRLCPHGNFIVPRMDVYRAVSKEIMDIVAAEAGGEEWTEIKGLDEAYVDVSRLCQAATADDSLDLGKNLAASLKSKISGRVNLPLTIGVASNKNLAKLICDDAKPNGLKVLYERDKVAYLKSKSVVALTGIGKKKGPKLFAAGYQTVGHLQEDKGKLVEKLGHLIGVSTAANLEKLVVGEDDDPVKHRFKQASFEKEHTFKTNTDDMNQIEARILEEAGKIEGSLRTQKEVAFTVHVTVAYSLTDEVTAQKTQGEPLAKAEEIKQAAMSLLKEKKFINKPIRKIGVGVSGLEPLEEIELTLF